MDFTDSSYDDALRRRLPGWLAAYLLYGVHDGVDPPRLVRAANLTCVVSMAMSSTFAVFFLAWDHRALWPMSVVIVLSVLAQAITPVFYRRSPTLGNFWIVGAVLAMLTLNGWLSGADAGLHLFMLTVPPLLMLSSELARPRSAAVFTVMAFAAICWVQTVPDGPPAFMKVDPLFQAAAYISTIAGLFAMLMFFIYYALSRMKAAETALQAEYARSERLLDNLLPEKIAARLKDEPDSIIADSIGQTTILFADIVDFTPRAASMAPEDLVRFLNRVFTAFDAETEARGLEKIKTIGDAYMVAAGMPDPREDHAAAIAEMALKMLEICERQSVETGQPVSVRIGMHTGPAVAGVIGTRKFFYDVWGDTVNTAARMESHGEPGRIQITAETKAALGDAYLYEPRGVVEIKGKGRVETWWLIGPRLARET